MKVTTESEISPYRLAFFNFHEYFRIVNRTVSVLSPNYTIDVQDETFLLSILVEQKEIKNESANW